MKNNEKRSDTGSIENGPDRYTHEVATELPKSAFGRAIDRRSFLRVAATTGAALVLPSTVSADITDDTMTDLAEFVVNATPEGYEATLVVEFADVDGLETFAEKYAEPDWTPEESLHAPKAVTRTEPTPAAHAALTADELDSAFGFADIELVDFSPGANPFWKLQEPYADGVFPDVVNARDWISHREAGQALDHLTAEYPDRVRVHRIGEGPGWENFLTGEDPDQHDIYVAELTNDVRNEESFREKDKAVFTVGIHGNERAGVEAGSRILEAAATGEADDINQLLDDIVIVYVYINPDGWTVRDPHYGPHPTTSSLTERSTATTGGIRRKSIRIVSIQRSDGRTRRSGRLNPKKRPRDALDTTWAMRRWFRMRWRLSAISGNTRTWRISATIT